MVGTDILSLYYGCMVKMNRTVAVQAGSSIRNFEKNSEQLVTPGFLHLVQEGLLPVDSYKLILRKIHQLEDSEIIELAEILAKRKSFDKNFVREVKRSQQGNNLTIEVTLSIEKVYSYSFVINQFYDAAIAEMFMTPISTQPSVAHIAVMDQARGMMWMRGKQLDFLGLIPRGLARSRKKWTKDHHNYTRK